MTARTLYSWNKNNLLLEVQVQTKANKNAILGEHNQRLKIAITASPTAGQANNHLIKFLAKHFDVPQKQVTIIKGHTNKIKLIAINAPKNNFGEFALKNGSLG